MPTVRPITRWRMPLRNTPTVSGASLPELAAVELERAVKELGLLGAMMNNHLEDMSHYDDEHFLPVFETAERLNVPIYIYPAPPSATEVKTKFEGSYSSDTALALSTGAWGWHEDVGLHILKPFAAGLFLRHPKLKIIIGHMGELTSMTIDRMDTQNLVARSGLGKCSEV
ncbi:hypothetical protein F4775DRAFT_568644 [Biscogniauxia sp. FL1348]|nr:hypothetical protein F4775DRAFT_568644 [Biscogniauxia sp. FL1348]